MHYCEKCGIEIPDDTILCEVCEATIYTKDEILNTNNIANDSHHIDSIKNTPTCASAYSKTKVLSKKILPFAIIFIMLIAIINIFTSSYEKKKYEIRLDKVYRLINEGAEEAENYATLENKVWRNCIHKISNSQTDKYTKNSYGYFHSDFNKALTQFYSGEKSSYLRVSSNLDDVNTYIIQLKDCPKEYTEEYKAIRELYIAYNTLADLVVGNTSYSLTTYEEELNKAISNYKTAYTSAKLLFE